MVNDSKIVRREYATAPVSAAARRSLLRPPFRWLVHLLAAIRHDLRNNKSLLLMALPGVLLLFIFNYLPMFGIVIAFQDYRPNKGIFGSEWVWFENFRFLFGTGDAIKLTFRTIGYNAAFIAANQMIALTLAVLLNEVRSRWLSRLYQTVFFIPFFISWVVAGYLSFA